MCVMCVMCVYVCYVCMSVGHCLCLRNNLTSVSHRGGHGRVRLFQLLLETLSRAERGRVARGGHGTRAGRAVIVEALARAATAARRSGALRRRRGGGGSERGVGRGIERDGFRRRRGYAGGDRRGQKAERENTVEGVVQHGTGAVGQRSACVRQAFWSGKQ